MTGLHLHNKNSGHNFMKKGHQSILEPFQISCSKLYSCYKYVFIWTYLEVKDKAHR